MARSSGEVSVLSRTADANRRIIPPVIVIAGPIPVSTLNAAINPNSSANTFFNLFIPAKNNALDSSADIPATERSFLLIIPTSAKTMLIIYNKIDK